MDNLEKRVEKYLSAVKKQLILPSQSRRSIVDHARNEIKAFLEENETVGFDDVLKAFGSPDILARSYMDNVDQALISKEKARRRRIQLAAALLGVLVLILAISLAVYSWHIRGRAYIKETTVIYSNEIPSEVLEAEDGEVTEKNFVDE